MTMSATEKFDRSEARILGRLALRQGMEGKPHLAYEYARLAARHADLSIRARESSARSAAVSL